LRIIVYVEGPGDRRCLETLLSPLIAGKNAAGIHIQFVPATSGDHKVELLTNKPTKAANILMNDDSAYVVILPDLYPRNKAFPHTTCSEMRAGIISAFHRKLERSHASERMLERFGVFCLIHDVEVLLLAAEESLSARCNLSTTPWKKPVEDQNHNQPPKRIIEALIPRYDSLVDGPRILAGVDYRIVAERCPHGFGPFVRFLESIGEP
jgi:hypothetical protein